jgi:hypothetical protein
MQDTNHPPPGSGGKKAMYSNPDRKPDVRPVNPDGIPAELKAIRRWVLWTLTWKANKDGTGKWDKVPKTAASENASSTNPKTWGTFDAVFAAFQSGRFDGTGFVLGDGFAGIDLDVVRTPTTGELLPWAGELLTDAVTYADVSPSGTGVKLFGRGVWRGDWHKRPHPSSVGEVEVYDGGRFFTLTGYTAGVSADVADIQPTLDSLVTLFDAKQPDDVLSPPPGAAGGGWSLPDDELLERIRRSAQAEKFARLWAGTPPTTTRTTRPPTSRSARFWHSGAGRTPTASTACSAGRRCSGRSGTSAGAPRPTGGGPSTRRSPAAPSSTPRRRSDIHRPRRNGYDHPTAAFAVV